MGDSMDIVDDISSGVSPPRPTHFRRMSGYRKSGRRSIRWEIAEPAQDKIDILIPRIDNYDWSKETRGNETSLAAKKRCYEEMVSELADDDPKHIWLRCEKTGHRYPFRQKHKHVAELKRMSCPAQKMPPDHDVEVRLCYSMCVSLILYFDIVV